MQVVAGPSGSGKSSLFPVAATGVDHFNVDDRCAQLNGGSYLGITPAIRARANAQCEAFVADHIAARQSFAIETTLRTDITLRQAAEASATGFVLLMEYVAVGSPEECIRRVTIPAWQTSASGARDGRRPDHLPAWETPDLARTPSQRAVTGTTRLAARSPLRTMG